MSLSLCPSWVLLQEALCEAEAELETEGDGDGEVEGEVETETEYPAVIVEPVPSAGRLEQCFAAQVLVYDDQTYLMQGVAQEQEVETEMVESGKGFSPLWPISLVSLTLDAMPDTLREWEVKGAVPLYSRNWLHRMRFDLTLTYLVRVWIIMTSCKQQISWFHSRISNTRAERWSVSSFRIKV